jgi:hypothetical protein
LFAVRAQTSQTPAGWKFHSINQAGLLNGESKTAFHLQSVNGIQYKNLFAGIGVGLDYYKYRSIPLFIELRKYFGATKNQFFVYADGGANFVWAKSNGAYNNTVKYYPGFYGNAGIGYKAVFKNGMGILLSAGYSYKKIKEEQSSGFCPMGNTCYLQTDTYKYDFNRLIIQIGWMF